MDNTTFNPIELQLRMAFDKLSNGDPITVEDEWIEQAGEEFKAAIRQRLTDDKTFRLRMSNIGRPACILQKEKEASVNGVPLQRQEYNHFLRMMLGHATETLVRFGLKVAGIQLSGSATKVEFKIAGETITGTDDIEIDNKVYDIKSVSPYGFKHKWSDGWDSLFHTDTFGYVEQLYGYANGDPQRMGGWIVVDKSSGELKVVEAQPNADQLFQIDSRVSRNVQKVAHDLPFEKCFSPEVELFYKEETGNLLVPKVCTFCQFMKFCWPDAKLMPRALSKAKEPTPTWYVKYENKE